MRGRSRISRIALEGMHAMKCIRSIRSLGIMSLVCLAACNSLTSRGPDAVPIVGPLTNTSMLLVQLPPPPAGPITVAVYDFPDLTGQRKSTTGPVSDLSTALTQGASALVIEALQSAGNGSIFRVVDRTRDADQARERSLIEASRSAARQPIGAIAAANASVKTGPKKGAGPATNDTAGAGNKNVKPLVPAIYIVNGGSSRTSAQSTARTGPPHTWALAAGQAIIEIISALPCVSSKRKRPRSSNRSPCTNLLMSPNWACSRARVWPTAYTRIGCCSSIPAPAITLKRTYRSPAQK